MKTDHAKFTGKKSKAAAKTGGVSRQWTILEKSGFGQDEISKFRCSFNIDTNYICIASRGFFEFCGMLA